MKGIGVDTAFLHEAQSSARRACAWNFPLLLMSVIICSACFTARPWEVGAAEIQRIVWAPQPPVWPETFHAVAVQNRIGSLALVDLYYEWSKGRNANLIHSQLGTTLYDIEYVAFLAFGTYCIAPVASGIFAGFQA